MSRKKPKTPPEVQQKFDPELIIQKRRYKLITPLYGGGVKPAEADPISEVRATEVRGHLRFWWRATQSGKYNSISDLKKAEDLIWGSTENASKVVISVNVSTEEIQKEPAFQVTSKNNRRRINPSPNVAPYAAFPLLPDKDEQKKVGWKSKEIVLGVKFTLNLRFPKELTDNIQAAIWAWETFGGIGARTRRGFGALQCIEIDDKEIVPATQEKIEQLIKSGLDKHVVESQECLRGVPHLHKNLRFKTVLVEGNDIDAWKRLIKSLQEFRQEKARYGKKYGLSQWPEANEVRRLFGKPPKLPDNVNEDSLVRKFPRAKLGLPIIIHMPHDRSLSESVTLQGNKTSNGKWLDRLASPLILRPLACSKGSVGLAVILEWLPSNPKDEIYTPPGGLILKDAPGDPLVYSDIEDTEVDNIAPLNGESDILQAFLNFLK